MDQSGVWNPPEMWPESSPPLAGWVRKRDGRWGPPEAVIDPNAVQVLDADIGAGEPLVIDLTSDEGARPGVERVPKSLTSQKRTLREVAAAQPASVRLGFAEPAVAEPSPALPTDRRRAMILAACSAIAAIIAGLLVVWLVL